MSSQERISEENEKFWDELCGSNLANSLGIEDSSENSLKKFDDWYFSFYPYLQNYIRFDELAGRDVLEVGLGYGTVSQKLAESGVNYTGIDIAAGPVAMVNHRLRQRGLGGEALRMSILSPLFEAESFDKIIAIGCLHHTGNLQLALDQCWKLLRPDGQLVFMVYNAYSYRRFYMNPLATLKHILKEWAGHRGVVGTSSKRERAAYDASCEGNAAPHTDWISVRSLTALCRKFSNITIKLENIDREFALFLISRKVLLGTPIPKHVGLDLYAVAQK
jgi:2-polyprenyl-3-methyl-5-hydroxy-6-metoxy-1,4-benzoquinol methylase